MSQLASIHFESGEVRYFERHSASVLELQLPDGLAAKPRRLLSEAQSLVFEVLMALYPPITKACFRFLHCQPSSGQLILASGPATSRISIVGNATVTDTVLMRSACAEADLGMHAAPALCKRAFRYLRCIRARCWSGAHLPVGALSIVLTITFVLGMPLCSLAYIRRNLHTLSSKSDGVGRKTGASSIGALPGPSP